MSAFARPTTLAQSPAQGFDLLLVGGFLPFGQFQSFEHFFHLLERVAKRGHDAIDLVNGFADLHRRRRTGGRLRRRGTVLLLLRLPSLMLGRMFSPTRNWFPRGWSGLAGFGNRGGSGFGGGEFFGRFFTRLFAFG
jgi:hypothetical protein